MKNKYSLTPKNLAMLGIMDEVYELYCTICDIYHKAKEEYHIKNGNDALLWGVEWDALCVKSVRDAFQPVLRAYIGFFSHDKRPSMNLFYHRRPKYQIFYRPFLRTQMFFNLNFLPVNIHPHDLRVGNQR